MHTHSEFATSWAQAGTAIPCYGTTHADYFHGEVPVTRPLTDEEIEADYEFNTGVVIAARFKQLDPLAVPGVLVANHAPFAWGKTAAAAAYNAVVLEYVAKAGISHCPDQRRSCYSFVQTTAKALRAEARPEGDLRAEAGRVTLSQVL